MNELQKIIIIRQQRVSVEQDRRYRIMVTYIRSDRPKYWNFLCPHCGTKVCELNNADIIAFDDFYNPDDYTGNTRHCKGSLPGGLPCQYSYFFHLQ